MIRPEFDATLIKRLTVELKAIEPGLARQLGKDIKSDLLPFAAAVQREMPSDSPLSGMINNGAKGWAPAIAKVSATPGAGYGRSMARIVFDTKAKQAGLKIAEFAGSSNFTKSTGPGRSMNEALERRFPLVKGRGGRFAFRAYYRKQPEMLAIIGRIIDRYIDIVNKRFS